MTEKKASQFKQASFRLHKTVLKTIREIARLYQYDGIKKLTQTDHCGMAILYYAKSLKSSFDQHLLKCSGVHFVATL